MSIAGNALVFIDVESSTPAVKQEREDIPDHESSPDISLYSVRTRKKETDDSLSSVKSRSKETDDCDTYNRPTERIEQAKPPQQRPASRFKCDMCHYHTYHRTLFTEHLNRHTGVKPYKCELCPYSSVSKKYTKKHQDKHKSCSCGFLSRNRHEFKRHVNKCGKNSAKPVTHACPSCKREYVDEKALAKHSASRRVCALCPLACCVTALRRHMTQAHGAPRRDLSKRERFQCALCPWHSSRSQKILLHLIHHPGQPVDETMVDVSVLRTCNILPEKQ